jgi:hypothetical protein
MKKCGGVMSDSTPSGLTPPQTFHDSGDEPVDSGFRVIATDKYTHRSQFQIDFA